MTTGQRVTVSSSPTFAISTSGDFTIEAWVKPSTSGGMPNSILSTRTGAFYGAGIYFGFFSSTQLILQLTSNVLSGNAPASVIDGKWHHVAVTRASGSLQFLLDGQPLNNPVMNTASVTGGTLTLGYDVGITSALGELSNVRFWNVGRTVAEIQANMDTASPAGTGLVANWRLAEGTGQNAFDATGNHSGVLGTNTTVEALLDPTWVAAP
jgi:hypothetical protein